MQSSVRSETPRLVTISANPSSTSIPINGGLQIDREVVVTSHIKHPSRRASYSPITPVLSSSGHVRAHSQEPRRGSLNKWDPSRVSDKSMRRQSRPSVALELADPVVPDTNRDNIRAMVEFLTKEPPPNNWMSMLSDDERSLRTVTKFKMFGSLKKKKKKVSKSPKFMQLPDVAVAARTIQGSRHIAISIPLEHDYPELLRPSIEQTKRPKSAPRLHGSEKGTVTVLKPLVEVRESNSSSPPLANGDNSAGSGRVRSTATPPIDILGIEATRTLEKYYRQQHQQQRMSKEGTRPEISRGRVLGVENSVPASKADQRLSIGTIYSTLAGSGYGAHSRGNSNASKVAVISPTTELPLNWPTRDSSKSTFPASVEEELRIESAKIAAELTKSHNILKSSNASLKSDSSHAPTIFGTATAETAREYHSPGPQYFSRSNSASAAPTKKLPDLPTGADGQIVRPSTAPLVKSDLAGSAKSVKGTCSVTNYAEELVDVTQQNRHERVKARKQRDMAAIQAKEDEPSPLISPTSPRTKSTRSSKQRSSQDSVAKRASITMSPIMLVANLSPYTGTVLPSDLPSPPSIAPRNLSKRTSTSSTSTIKPTSTSPASIHESECISDSDTIPRPHPRPRRSNSSSPSNSTLDARRQERRSKRNMTLHEKELDSRLSKIEKDNALLLHTLGNIASSFGQLNRLMPAQEAVVGSGEAEMEPLMRELSGGGGVVA